MTSRALYEDYHSSRKLQKRIIDRKNFTYRHIVELLDKYGKGRKVIDIGCGVGTVAFFLAKEGKNVTGIDISERAIGVASQNAKLLHVAKNISFKVMNFPRQAPMSKYDLVICSEILEHFADDSRALDRTRELFRKKGRIFITTPSESSFFYRMGLARIHDQRVGHLRRYSRKRMARLLKNKGFKIISMYQRGSALREALFMYPVLGFIVRVANRFNPIGVVITAIDDLFLKLFGGASHIFVVADKAEILK